MHSVQFEITKPTDEAAFEDMCVRIYSTVFNDPLAQTNGRRGQAQGGIDVFIDANTGRIGVQCKKYADGALKLKHVQHEVSEADRVNAPIRLLIIATTATSDAVLLREVQDLSDQRIREGKYPVKIEFWQDLCRHITGNSNLQNDYAPNAPGALFHRFDENYAELLSTQLLIASRLDMLTGLPNGRSDSLNKYITLQLDAVNDVLRNARFKDALENLQRIGVDMNFFDHHQQARWYVQRGFCSWHLESGIAAAADFIHAAELYSDDEKIAAAKIRGLLLLNRTDDAELAGEAARARFPASVHVWIAYTHTKMVKGIYITLADVPAAMRDDCDVLQLVAWARKEAGDLAGAVELSSKALTLPGAAFFVRNTALVLALESATHDPVKASYGLVNRSTIAALRKAVEALTPRQDRVWSVQSPESVQDTLVHLGYSYLVLGEPEESLVLVKEAQHAGVLSPRLKQVALDAYRSLDRQDELIKLGQESLSVLEEEALLLVAESASSTGNVSLVEAVQKEVEQKGFQLSEVPHLLQAMRWVALWRSGSAKQQAIEEVMAASIPNSESLAIICGGVQILHAAQCNGDETEAAIAKALTLVSKESTSAERLMLANLLFSTDKLELAARQYALLAPQGKHSELHNKLLRCYVQIGAFRKAKELILSFPDCWSNDERALHLAIDLGQQVSDWDFLIPLADLQCERSPQEVGGWLLRLTLDLQMRKMARFHQALMNIPADLSGSPRLLAHVASLELRFGEKRAGMRRLYGLFRRNLADANAASAFFISIVSGPSDLPFMDEVLTDVCPGSAVTLRGQHGETVTLTIDLDGFTDLPVRENFIAPTSDIARSLLGIAVGQPTKLPGSFGVEHHYVIETVESVFLSLLRVAQERLKSPVASDLPVMSVPVPTTDKGTDFSHMHALLKRQTEHSRRAFQEYADRPITLGILSKLLGRSVVDLVTGWPSDVSPLFVCTATSDQQKDTKKLLQRADVEYVIDAATVAELASLECLNVLAALPCVYISTKSVETLEALLEEAVLERAGGKLYDDNGIMRFIDYSSQDREQHTAFIQGMVDAVRLHCHVLPAYGPAVLPTDFKFAHKVLQDEEYSALLLSVEKDAVLFTVDGRLAQMGIMTAGLKSVWPQVVLGYALELDKLTIQQYSHAVVRMFLRNRSFVSLGCYDLLFMCQQGGHVLTEGLQRVKDYLSSGSTEPGSAISVGFEFLELQAQYPTQLKGYIELFGHIVEASLRHPQCDQRYALVFFRYFARKIAVNSISHFVPYAPIEDARQARIRLYIQAFENEINIAANLACKPIRRRAIKLRVLNCMRLPFITFDDSAQDPDNSIVLQTVMPSAEDEPINGGKPPVGTSMELPSVAG